MVYNIQNWSLGTLSIAHRILRTRTHNVSENGSVSVLRDRLCGLVVRVLGYRSGGPGSIPGTARKKKE
jgi:hypothetical protein